MPLPQYSNTDQRGVRQGQQADLNVNSQARRDHAVNSGWRRRWLPLRVNSALFEAAERGARAIAERGISGLPDFSAGARSPAREALTGPLGRSAKLGAVDGDSGMRKPALKVVRTCSTASGAPNRPGLSIQAQPNWRSLLMVVHPKVQGHAVRAGWWLKGVFDRITSAFNTGLQRRQR